MHYCVPHPPLFAANNASLFPLSIEMECVYGMCSYMECTYKVIVVFI